MVIRIALFVVKFESVVIVYVITITGSLLFFLQVVLCAQGEHLLTFKRLLTYVLDLAKCDLNYDVRDRAHVISKLLSFHLASQCQAADSHLLKNSDLRHELAEKILSGKAKSAPHTNSNFRFYLPGSLSHIVFHAAPGYEPLPKPCSLPYDDLQSSEFVPSTEILGQKTTNSDSGTNDPDTSSGSSDGESASTYNSEHSVDSLVESDGTGSASDTCDNGKSNPLLAGQATEDDDTRAPLIHLSDAIVDYNKPNKGTGENSSVSLVADLMSKKALESWLDEQPSFSEVGSSQQMAAQSSSARISLRDCGIGVEPKIHILLDPANGNGLKVDYSFSAEVSTISKFLVCVDIFFENFSMDPLKKIAIKDEESDGTPESTKQALETYER